MNNISYSEGNIFVRIWKHPDVQAFKDKLAKGEVIRTDYDTKLLQIIDEWNIEKDNPILFVFQMNV